MGVLRCAAGSGEEGKLVGESYRVCLGVGLLYVRDAHLGVSDSEKEQWGFEQRGSAGQSYEDVEGVAGEVRGSLVDPAGT